MSKESEANTRMNEELRKIEEQEKELKARKKELKDRQKALEKKNKKYSDMQYALEDKYEELDRTIKGTSRYDELLKEIAQMEEEVASLRDEIGKDKFHYTTEEELKEFMPKGSTTVQDTKSQASDLTEEQKQMLAAYMNAYHAIDQDKNEKTVDGKELSQAEARVYREGYAAVIKEVCTRFENEFKLTDEEKQILNEKSSQEIISSINLNELYSRAGFVNDSIVISDEISKDVDRSINERISDNVNANIDKKLKEMQISAERQKLDGNKEIHALEVVQEINNAMTAQKMQYLMHMGLDVSYADEANGFIVVEPEENGDLGIIDAQKRENSNDFKVKLPESRKEIVNPILDILGKNGTKKEGTLGEAIKRSEGSITVDKYLSLVKDAASQVMDELENPKDDELSISQIEKRMTRMSEYLDQDESQMGRIQKLRYNLALRSYMRNFEKTYGIDLGKGKEARREAFGDIYCDYGITKMQYDKASNVIADIENIEEDQKFIDSIEGYDTLMANKEKLQELNLYRTELTLDGEYNPDSIEGRTQMEVDSESTLSSISLSQLRSLGYRRTTIDGCAYDVMEDERGNKVSIEDARIISNTSLINDLFDELDDNIDYDKYQAEERSKALTVMRTQVVEAHCDLSLVVADGLGVDIVALHEEDRKAEAAALAEAEDEDEYDEDFTSQYDDEIKAAAEANLDEEDEL